MLYRLTVECYETKVQTEIITEHQWIIDQKYTIANILGVDYTFVSEIHGGSSAGGYRVIGSKILRQLAWERKEHLYV